MFAAPVCLSQFAGQGLKFIFKQSACSFLSGQSLPIGSCITLHEDSKQLLGEVQELWQGVFMLRSKLTICYSQVTKIDCMKLSIE